MRIGDLIEFYNDRSLIIEKMYGIILGIEFSQIDWDISMEWTEVAVIKILINGKEEFFYENEIQVAGVY